MSSDRTKFVSVQQGNLRGRRIQLPPAVHGHRHFTSALLKEAFFQLIEKHRPSPFYDLCSGSGQMAMEALSRGFMPVHLIERDEKRFSFLLKQFQGLKLHLHKKDFRRMAPVIGGNGGVIYLDVPYSFWSEDGICLHIEEFLAKLRAELSSSGLPVILGIQAPRTIRFTSPDLERWLFENGMEQRDYRGHILLVVEFIRPSA